MSLDDLIDKVDDIELRKIVKDWASKDDDFRQYVSIALGGAGDDIDFDGVLSRAIAHEAMVVASPRQRGAEVLNWGNIYYYIIEPWASKADNMSTQALLKLIVAITVRIGMVLKDEDFFGDDWYGDDYGEEIGNILGTLGNFCGLVLTKDDLSHSDLEMLAELFEDAEMEDAVSDYIDTPYSQIRRLIDIRNENNDCVEKIYNELIKARWCNKSGYWICAKIDFIKALGREEEAQQIFYDNLKYPEVCLKLYNELVSCNRWQEALNLLDKAQEIKDSNSRWYLLNSCPDWRALKRQLLDKLGTKEAQIDL